VEIIQIGVSFSSQWKFTSITVTNKPTEIFRFLKLNSYLTGQRTACFLDPKERFIIMLTMAHHWTLLSWMNSVKILFFQGMFNRMLSSTPRSYKWSRSLRIID
jgi:hypothetical protein